MITSDFIKRFHPELFHQACYSGRHRLIKGNDNIVYVVSGGSKDVGHETVTVNIAKRQDYDVSSYLHTKG